MEVLLKNLRQLQRKGATIVVIEHDIDVIQQSDYIIEMGEKGPEGGQIITSGTPFDIYYYYMIALALVFRGIIPTIENLFWDRSYTLIGEIKVSWLLSYIVLYPCIGYFLKNKFEITKNKLIFIWIINILGILTSCYFTCCKGISEGIARK